MIAIGKLINHPEFYFRMIAVRHAWAIMYMKNGEHINAAMQFRVARDMLEEIRERAEHDR